ncbi:hypothetical protein [Pseudomonas aeruginosa]|nr:hypothetical protein CSC45_3096 [Pseudomonas aeruginosa]
MVHSFSPAARLGRTTEPPGAGVSREEYRCQRSVRELARELERSFTEQ